MIAIVPIGGLIILFSVQPPNIKGGCAGFLRLDGLAGDPFVLGSAARVRGLRRGRQPAPQHTQAQRQTDQPLRPFHSPTRSLQVFALCFAPGRRLTPAGLHHLRPAGLLGGRHPRSALSLCGLRPRPAGDRAGRRSDAAGMPRAFGAVLRRLYRRGRSMADPRPRSKGAEADACGAAAHSGHHCALHGPGDRDPPLLLPDRSAGAGMIPGEIQKS